MMMMIMMKVKNCISRVIITGLGLIMQVDQIIKIYLFYVLHLIYIYVHLFPILFQSIKE